MSRNFQPSIFVNFNNFTHISVRKKRTRPFQSHPDAQATYIKTMPECHMPFHWPRLDKDLLLCVRIIDVKDCMWSGGIRLDDNYSLTINVRDATGRMHFLRVDVVLQESTYFIVFTDADTMPPPIRVDNFSEVALTVNQVMTRKTSLLTNMPFILSVINSQFLSRRSNILQHSYQFPFAKSSDSIS